MFGDIIHYLRMKQMLLRYVLCILFYLQHMADIFYLIRYRFTYTSIKYILLFYCHSACTTNQYLMRSMNNLQKRKHVVRIYFINHLSLPISWYIYHDVTFKCILGKSFVRSKYKTRIIVRSTSVHKMHWITNIYTYLYIP